MIRLKNTKDGWSIHINDKYMGKVFKDKISGAMIITIKGKVKDVRDILASNILSSIA